MRWLPWWVVLVAHAACGRVAFDPTTATDGGTSDPDAMPECKPEHLFCNPMEMLVLGSVWNGASGMISTDTTTKYRGTASLRMTIPFTPAATQAASFVSRSDGAIASATELWIRAWVRTSALPAATNALELLGLDQTFGTLGLFVFARSDDFELYHQFDAAQNGAGEPLPIDTWFCLVWHLQLRTTGGSSSLASSVAPTFSITDSVTQGSPALDRVVFGPFFATNNVDVDQPGFDVWYDDVIIDDAPVTCAD